MYTGTPKLSTTSITVTHLSIWAKYNRAEAFIYSNKDLRNKSFRLRMSFSHPSNF